MEILIAIVKIIATLFLIGGLLGSVTKLIPAFRNPNINPALEFIAGGIMLSVVLYGFYYTWF